jgi:8-oxo-dGTP pyrophosphatase MutT (NUDIX family)
VLLIRNSYRRPISLPSGGAKRGEDLVHAAARELAEEVGISLPPGRLRPFRDYCIRHEFSRDIIRLFEVDLDEEGDDPPKPRVDYREVIWAGFRTRQAALSMELFPVVERYLVEQD